MFAISSGVAPDPVCFHCQQGGKLVTPCYCAATVRLHTDCLKKWMGPKEENACDNCGFQFRLEKKRQPKSDVGYTCTRYVCTVFWCTHIL